MAKKKKDSNIVGKWAFLIGVVLALVFGVVQPYNSTVQVILIVIGLLVGVLNVTAKEVRPFLLSGVSLIIASALGQAVNVVGTIPILAGMLNSLLAIFVPATIIVAIKNVFELAKD